MQSHDSLLHDAGRCHDSPVLDAAAGSHPPALEIFRTASRFVVPLDFGNGKIGGLSGAKWGRES